MKSFLAPGVLLMRRLSLVRKFLLVSFFMLLPLAYTGTLYLSEVGGRVNVVLAERDGLRYINPLLKLSRLAQDHRGATYVIAKGNPELKQFRSQVQEKIRSVVQEIDRVEEELGARYGSAPRWRLITEKLNRRAIRRFARLGRRVSGTHCFSCEYSWFDRLRHLKVQPAVRRRSSVLPFDEYHHVKGTELVGTSGDRTRGRNQRDHARRIDGG